MRGLKTASGLWKRKLAIAWMAQFLSTIGIDIALPFLPFYIRELGVADVDLINWWTGIIMSACSIAIALASPLWGVIADRFGAKWMVQRAAFGATATLLAMAFAANVQQLFVLRVIQGFITGISLSFVMLVSSFAPLKQMGYSLGIMQTALFIAYSIGPVVGGILADLFGYRQTFLIASIFPFIGGVLILWSFRALDVQGMRQSAQFDSNPTLEGSAQKRTIGSMIGIIFISSVIYMSNSTSRPILPMFIETLLQQKDLLNTNTGIFYAVHAFASAISAVLIGRMGDRTGHRPILILCSLGAAFSFLGQSFAPNFSVFLVLSFFVGFCIGGLLPTINAFLARASPVGRQGAIYGFSNSINAVGRTFGPIAGAAVAARWGMRSTFGLSAVLFSLSAFWILIADRFRNVFYPSE
jgi:DHA1 family multidrug resistance protein-like MFS transporter